MSDRCWTKVICRPEHRALFEEEGFAEDPHEAPKDLPGAIAMVNEGAIGAGDSLFRELAERGGVPFYATHGAGVEYGEGRYACDGKSLVNVDCTGGSCPVVEVGPDGVPNQDQMKNVAEYYNILTTAKDAISGLPRVRVPPERKWSSADEILEAMDPKLFREQRSWLLEVREAIQEGRLIDTGDGEWDEAVYALGGLVHLLDDVADYAHDVLGMDCLLEEEGGGTDGD